jgi:hypothetical protein
MQSESSGSGENSPGALYSYLKEEKKTGKINFSAVPEWWNGRRAGLKIR